MLRRLPSLECYRKIDDNIIDLTELDEAESHLQYLVQSEPKKYVLENKSVKRSSSIAPFSLII